MQTFARGSKRPVSARPQSGSARRTVPWTRTAADSSRPSHNGWRGTTGIEYSRTGTRTEALSTAARPGPGRPAAESYDNCARCPSSTNGSAAERLYGWGGHRRLENGSCGAGYPLWWACSGWLDGASRHVQVAGGRLMMPDSGQWFAVGLDSGGTAINATVIDSAGRFLVGGMVESPSCVLDGPDKAIEALARSLDHVLEVA